MIVELPQTAWQREMRSMARRPILDRKSRLVGYELCFPRVDRNPAGTDDGHASRTILDDVVLFGLNRLTGNMPAFIRCNADMLHDGWVQVLPADLVVLEISTQIECCQLLVETCARLRDSGFRLAIVDCDGDPVHHPLYPLASYLKFDLSHLRLTDCNRILAHPTPAIMATNVNTQGEYRDACKLGASFIQGLYFCCPDILQAPKIPPSHHTRIEILRELQSDPLLLKRLCPIVERDAALVYRLLRMANSPMCAIRQEVKSIESAIMFLGDNTFRRIAGLAILSELSSGQPAEVFNMAVVRARFCELTAKRAGLNPGEQYLLGMLSLLPAMLLCPMEKLVSDLPLRPAIQQALLDEPVPEAAMLAWIKSYEKNNFQESCDIALAHRLNQQQLTQFYIDAVVWTASWQ
jgi:EAL and modified HD-GYP domain-containing signal transduction protein